MSESTFEALLEQTARSLAVHGFRRICFLGDSGGNQTSQERVAKLLNAEWAGSGVRVVHLGDYYARSPLPGSVAQAASASRPTRARPSSNS